MTPEFEMLMHDPEPDLEATRSPDDSDDDGILLDLRTAKDLPRTRRRGESQQ